jgi:hypothetical protein
LLSDPTKVNPLTIKIDFGENTTGFLSNDITVTNGIMLPFFHTSKEDFLISPQYDTFGNFLSPSRLGLLIA